MIYVINDSFLLLSLVHIFLLHNRIGIFKSNTSQYTAMLSRRIITICFTFQIMTVLTHILPAFIGAFIVALMFLGLMGLGLTVLVVLDSHFDRHT